MQACLCLYAVHNKTDLVAKKHYHHFIWIEQLQVPACRLPKPIGLVQTALQLCGNFANVHAESAHVLRSSSKFAQLQAVLTSAGVYDPGVNILQIAV